MSTSKYWGMAKNRGESRGCRDTGSSAPSFSRIERTAGRASATRQAHLSRLLLTLSPSGPASVSAFHSASPAGSLPGGTSPWNTVTTCSTAPCGSGGSTNTTTRNRDRSGAAHTRSRREGMQSTRKETGLLCTKSRAQDRRSKGASATPNWVVQSGSAQVPTSFVVPQLDLGQQSAMDRGTSTISHTRQLSHHGWPRPPKN
mmetsp:Transcript_1531/g.3156  ORF Transcript_1531/g.3156 Transcript_1531/m.3156 type:complete len:201 (+) Transcript_1531:273-875(+)